MDTLARFLFTTNVGHFASVCCCGVPAIDEISALGIPLFITVSYFNYENVGLITVPRRVILYVIHRFLYPGIFSELTRINVISLISV